MDLNEDYNGNNEKQRNELKIRNDDNIIEEVEADKGNFFRSESPNFQMSHASDNFFPQNSNKEKIPQEASAAKSNSQMKKYPLRDADLQAMTSGVRVV